MYRDDGLSPRDMHALLDRFPAQPLDFFGALRAGTYDNQIRDWIEGDILRECAIRSSYTAAVEQVSAEHGR